MYAKYELLSCKELRKAIPAKMYEFDTILQKCIFFSYSTVYRAQKDMKYAFPMKKVKELQNFSFATCSPASR